MSEERVNTGGTVSFVYTDKDKPQLKLKDKRFLENYYQNIELAQERQELLNYKRAIIIKKLTITIVSILALCFLVWGLFLR